MMQVVKITIALKLNSGREVEHTTVIESGLTENSGRQQNMEALIFPKL